MSIASLFLLLLVLGVLGLAFAQKPRRAIVGILLGVVFLVVFPLVLFRYASLEGPHTPEYRFSLDGETLTSGQVVGTGRRWQEDYEKRHVADVYSSDVQAIQSVARQCASELQRMKYEGSTPPRVRLKRSTELTESQFATFSETLREALPERVLVTEDEPSLVELGLRFRHKNHAATMGTFFVLLTVEGAEKELSANVFIKPWVRDTAQFRFAPGSPEHYFVAIGQPDYSEGAGERPARAFAAEHIKPLIASALPDTTPHFRGYTKNDKLMTQLAGKVTRDLITDSFVQTFNRSVDGTQLRGRLRRDAVLVDCSPQKFDRALAGALQEVSRGRPYPTQHVDEEMLLAFGGFSGLVFAVLLIISKLFDRSQVPPRDA